MTDRNTNDTANPADDEFSDTADDEIINPVLAEIHAIRHKLYEKTKDMSTEEFTNYINCSVAPVLKKYGIKSVSRFTERKPKDIHKKTS